MNSDNRKGELSELRTQLRQLAGSRAVGIGDAKRDLYKKVINYMTIGIDVSSLFSATSDLVLKKMCYLYVCNYAVVNPELALLTINFLQKDCRDDDPMIRGLALRSLCALRVKNLVEYLVDPLRQGLKDNSSYVRTVAAMGVLKLYTIAPQACKDTDFVNTLKALLMHDPDAQVVANCLSSLQEILTSEANLNNESAARERDVLYSKAVVYALLNRIKDFSEWAQCLVLDVASKYVPNEPSETFDIMNLLEDRLQHANSAVVLATTKVFLHLTLSMADVHQQVYERIKAPLLTLMSTSNAEQSYAVLSHLSLLVARAPMLFAQDYKHFFCRFSDNTYVKKLKLEMLTAVANENNTYEIVTELSEYAANVDVVIARESIRAVGQIALQSYDVNGIVDRLLQFLEMDTDYVTAETLEHRGPLDVTDPEVLVSPGPLASPAQRAAAQQYSENDTLLSASEKEESRVAGTTSNGPSSHQRALENLSFDLLTVDPPPTLSNPRPAAQPSASLARTPSPPSTAAAAYSSPAPAPALATSAPLPPAPAAISSLDDLLGLGVSSPAPAPAPPPPPAAPVLRLHPKPALDAPTFQRKWGQLPIFQTLDEQLSFQGSAALTGPPPLLRHMATCSIQCMASGGQAPNLKFFFYAQTADAAPGSSYFLVELVVHVTSRKATAKVKVDDQELGLAFTNHFRTSLAAFGMV
eukprot:jgi/Mesen1/859/ME000114S10944